ncbi:MAG: hypothetical protein AAFY71_11345 [Bacteroidota bacterium]
MKKLWFIGLIPLLFLSLESCDPNANPLSEGTLEFSTDTLSYDSLFVNFLSPTEILITYNNSGHPINIDRVWLEEGADSEFDMIVDGVRGREATDVVIPNGDSIHLFINLKSELRDDFAEEYLNFQIGDEVQKVLLLARVKDAYLFKARYIRTYSTEPDFIRGYFFGQSGVTDTVLTPEKPIIFDGPIIVPEGFTLTILPGTEIFFTPHKINAARDTLPPDTFAFFSTLIVGGTLIAEGAPGAPITFQGTRFDSSFLEKPAQWRGLRFAANSRNNVMEYCKVKNALIGIEVDSTSVNDQPKLSLKNSEVRNSGAYGLWSLGFDLSGTVTENAAPSVYAENSLFNTAKERNLYILAGGKYEFYNCTFANYGIGFSRRTPQILVRNWFLDFFDPTQANIFPTYADFKNCIVYGSEEDEFVIDTLEGGAFDRLLLENCLLPLSEDNDTLIRPHLKNCLVNVDPLFNMPFERDYRPQAGSPVIDAGVELSPLIQNSILMGDFRGPDFPRSLPLDIGAYEFYEIE